MGRLVVFVGDAARWTPQLDGRNFSLKKFVTIEIINH
jgi:hypothetical protein